MLRRLTQPKIYTTDVPKYVEREDLIELLNREYCHLSEDGVTWIFKYTLETSIEGTHKVTAPRKITDEEIKDLQNKSAERRAPPGVGVFGY